MLSHTRSGAPGYFTGSEPWDKGDGRRFRYFPVACNFWGSDAAQGLADTASQLSRTPAPVDPVAGSGAIRDEAINRLQGVSGVQRPP